MTLTEYFVYIIVAGIHGGVYHIRNSGDVFETLLGLRINDRFKIKGIGTVKIVDIETVSGQQFGMNEQEYVYFRTTAAV